MQNKLGANLTSYHAYSLEEALMGVAQAGYRFVELTAIRGVVEHVPLDADQNTLNGIRQLLESHGLQPVALAGHSDLTTAGGVDDGLKALEICADLGIPVLNTAVGGAFNEDEDENAFLENIHEFADDAAKTEVTIALEIHGTLTGTGKKTRQLVEKVNHPNVGVGYDTANAEFYAGVPVEDDLPNALCHIVHCHLKDTCGGQRNWNFPTLGEGKNDFPLILSLLKKSGYGGALTVEIEFEQGPPPPLETIHQAMRDSHTFLKGI